jgi:NTE family protein
MRGLVLAGGGSRGSWEAGALKYMGEVVDQLWPGGFHFMSGTSVGAINVAGLAQFKPDEFKAATLDVVKTWNERIARTKDVWQLRFPLGVPGLWNPSVGTNDQLETLLTDVVNIQRVQDSGVEVRFAAVDVESGDLIIYTGADLVEHGVKPIMASASYPMAFPPVEIGSHWLTDGGVRDTAPLGAAIKAGCDEIVVLTTRDVNIAGTKPRDEMGNVVNFGLRCLSIQFHEVLQNDIALCETHNHWARLGGVLRKHGVIDSVVKDVLDEMKPKKEIKLTVLYPSSQLGTSLDFSGDVMQAQIAQGYEDAKGQLAPLLG